MRRSIVLRGRAWQAVVQLVIECRITVGLVTELGAKPAQRRSFRSAAVGYAHRCIGGEDVRVQQAKLPAEVGAVVVANERL